MNPILTVVDTELDRAIPVVVTLAKAGLKPLMEKAGAGGLVDPLGDFMEAGLVKLKELAMEAGTLDVVSVTGGENTEHTATVE